MTDPHDPTDELAHAAVDALYSGRPRRYVSAELDLIERFVAENRHRLDFTRDALLNVLEADGYSPAAARRYADLVAELAHPRAA